MDGRKRSIYLPLKPVSPSCRLDVPATPGPLDLSLLIGDFALGLWLWYACASFVETTFSWWPSGLWVALAAAGCSWLLGLHRRPPAPPLTALLGRAALLAPLLALLVFAGIGLQGPQPRPAFVLWFGAALSFLCAAFRLSFWAARSKWPGQPLEILRWLVAGAVGFALLLPFYGRHGFGSGDVYWYTAMLADMIAQVRHGVFPVWVGQSPYAFTGALSPLRLAPLFQYAGAGLDLATGRALEPSALVNAVICGGGLVTAASAYLAVRFALPGRPNLACLLALLWLVSPGVLAPLYSGFQYMEWVAMPFVPVLLFGCWRLWTRDDGIARLAIVAGVAGMMLGHTPTGLWGGLLGAGLYLGHMATGKSGTAAFGKLAAMALGFIVLGGFAIGSALAIDHPANIGAGQPWHGFAGIFPGNFLPINIRVGGIETYQLGYTLLGAGFLAIILLLWLRPRGSGAFVAAMLVFALLLVPVTGATNWIWSHAPPLILTITNAPSQRLFEFWGITIVFGLVLALSQARVARQPRSLALVWVLLAGGAAWSAKEAVLLVSALHVTAASPAEMNISLRAENLQLARFAYASFANAPGYASHAHMDPELENRLLDRTSLKLMAANADAAAPRVQPDSDLETLPRLAQAGLWVATSDNHTRIYRLAPALRLASGQRYALRLDFLAPEKEGVLQVVSRDIFREYLLPDSGVGLAGTALAFGSLPTSGHVAALEQNSGGPVTPDLRFVAPQYAGAQFDFARFWLFAYEAANLPVRVSSWIPYRAETETAVPAYLETPRIWQKGWQARVNGRRVSTGESPQHLVMVPIEPGTSRVVLTFHAPLWLSAWFWCCLASWALLLASGAICVGRRAVT